MEPDYAYEAKGALYQLISAGRQLSAQQQQQVTSSVHYIVDAILYMARQQATNISQEQIKTAQAANIQAFQTSQQAQQEARQQFQDQLNELVKQNPFLNSPIPFPFIPTPEPRLFYAEVIYERIEKNIQDTLTDLPEDEEVTVFVMLNDGTRIVAESFGYHNPSFIVVYGIDTATGNSTEAFISHTNIQMLINRSKKQQEKPQQNIGFRGNAA